MQKIEYKNKELVFLSDLIRGYRTRYRISQFVMANLLGISLNTYRSKELNNTFTPDELERCAKHLNLDITFTVQEIK